MRRVIFVVSLLTLTIAHAELPDPTTVPAEQRVAAINRLFESPEGADTDRHYQMALERFVPLWSVGAPGDGDPNAQSEADATLDQVIADEHKLWTRFDWPTEYVPHVDRWLGANADALAALSKAVAEPRWYQPFSAESGRLSEVELIGSATKLRSLLKLRALAAARLARDGHWALAARLSAGNLRIAVHARQRPILIWQMFGGVYEIIATEQLTTLLPHMDADNLDWLRSAIHSERTAPTATDEQIDFAENLYAWDGIERYHEWARDEARHPSVREEISSVLEMHTLLTDVQQLGLKVEQPSFQSVDEFKMEVRKTTPQASWQVLRAMDAAYGEWEALPLPKALEQLVEYGERRQEIARKDPIARLLDEISIFRPGHFRLMRAVREARWSGLDALIALHRFKAIKNVWPARLEALVPDYLAALPLDPYSSKPLVYRPSEDGAEFVLYSVGENRKDDGGRRDETMTARAETGDLVFWPPERPAFGGP